MLSPAYFVKKSAKKGKSGSPQDLSSLSSGGYGTSEEVCAEKRDLSPVIPGQGGVTPGMLDITL